MNFSYSKHVREALAKVLLCSGFFHACGTYGIGLGELEHTSFLGQRLDAQIEIIGAEDILPSNIKIRQLNHVDAEKLGVDLLYTPYTYKLTPELKNGVLRSIRFSSNENIVEPYINVLIQLQWPSGSVLREYALLFDAAPIYSAGVKNLTQKDNSSQNQSGSSPRSTAETLGLMSPGAAYVVRPGDTLSGIVSSLDLPDGVSTNQAITAIFESNPQAFQSNNINLLKAGAKLQLPSGPAIASAKNSRAAIKDNPRSTSSRVKLKDAEAKPTQNTSQGSMDKTGRLTLSEPDLGLREGGADYDVPQIQEQIDGTQEMIDLLVKENQELRERIENIESSEYLNTLNELVSMQRQQISELQEVYKRTEVSPQKPMEVESGQGTSVADPILTAAKDIQQKGPTFSEVLAANFWVFISLVVIGFLSLIALALYAIQKLSAKNVSKAGQKSYENAAAFVEDDEIEDEMDEAFVLPETITDHELGGLESERQISQVSVKNVTPIGGAVENKRNATLSERLEKERLERDDEVKARIRQKTEEYNSDGMSARAPAHIHDVEIDVLVGIDEEVNELLSMAKIYCSAGKFSEARAILSAQNEAESDPRLRDALQQIDEMERNS